MDELTTIRQHIDEIDEKLLPLLKKRMELSKKAAVYKAEKDIPVRDEEREREILEKAERYGDEIKTVYGSVLKASREVQEKTEK